MQYFLILTQSTHNKSVLMIKRALINRLKIDQKDKELKVIVWDLENIRIVGGDIVHRPKNSPINSITIPLSDIQMVIKRTWWPNKISKATNLCTALAESGVKMLNSLSLSEWCNSKILQYRTLENENVFPTSICFDKSFIAENAEMPAIAIAALITQEMSGNLAYPVIFKTDKGCRSKGVFLVESERGLIELIEYLKHQKYDGGILLQEFLKTNADSAISTYYRINIIDGKAQSAVCFEEMMWIDYEGYEDVKKLIVYDGDSRAVSLSEFDSVELGKVIDLCPSRNGVVGVDVVIANNRMYLLEFNAGPGINELVQVARTNPVDPVAAHAVLCFADAIAASCLKRITLSSQELIPTMTH